MYCPNCGNKIEDGAKFCPYDGTRLDGNRNSWQQQGANFNYKLDKKKQPTKALVMEGIGLVFFIYLLLVNSLANRSSETEAWLNDHGTPVLLIGLVFIGISYFMFKAFKKKQPLVGLGYVGYIVSCIYNCNSSCSWCSYGCFNFGCRRLGLSDFTKVKKRVFAEAFENGL